MSVHRPRTSRRIWWPASLLVSAALLVGGWWLVRPDEGATTAQGRRILADAEPLSELGTCQSFVEFELSACVPHFPLHLSPPLGGPLDFAQTEEVVTAGNAYNNALYEDTGLQPFARLSPLRAPWDEAADGENVAGAATDFAARMAVVLVNGALRPGGFHALEHCWDGRLNPCADAPAGWTGWLRLRQPFSRSRFVELLEDARPRLDPLIVAATEFRAPASPPPPPEAPSEATSEATPVPLPKSSPSREALLPPACPPRRNCETEQRQLTVALETNLHLSQSLDHLTEAPAAWAEPLIREAAQPAGNRRAHPPITIPAKPFTWQKPPPCDTERAEEAINGGCWMAVDKVAPCPELAEHKGKCYVAVRRADAVPPQSEARDGEAR